jgi:hypothetical protein
MSGWEKPSVSAATVSWPGQRSQADVRQPGDGHQGRPRPVWLGAAGAFVVHVTIATTVGVAMFAVLPRRAVDAVVMVLFLFGAVYAWPESTKRGDELAQQEATKDGVVLTAFAVIFLAEWGDIDPDLLGTSVCVARVGSVVQRLVPWAESP